MVAVQFFDMDDDSDQRSMAIHLVRGVGARIKVDVEVAERSPFIVFSHREDQSPKVLRAMLQPDTGGVRMNLQLKNDDTIDAQVWTSDGYRKGRTADVDVAKVIADFLYRSRDWRGPPAESLAWAESTERLLGRVARLLDQRDQLEMALATALHDRDVAEARVAELESMYWALHRERYETKDQTDKTFLVLVATAIFTLLGPLAAVALDHHMLSDDIAGARQAAQEVNVDCGDTSIKVILPPQAPPSHQPPTSGLAGSG